MSLSWLAILLGLGYAAPQVYGLLKPQPYRVALRGFARSGSWGTGLMLAATVWVLWNLHCEDISDFAAYKPVLMVGFAAVGVGACVYLRDFLSVRGLAVLFLLLAKVMVDTARWAESDWRWVISRAKAQQNAPVTILVGHLTDQAMLSGVLNALYNLHLPLLSVENLDEK